MQTLYHRRIKEYRNKILGAEEKFIKNWLVRAIGELDRDLHQARSNECEFDRAIGLLCSLLSGSRK
jgi:hypothetical protein